MLTREDLDALRAVIPPDPDRARLLGTLRERAAPVLNALPPIPETKALLSRDGGVCPKDGAPLRFDPWSQERHTCSRCGESYTGERHFRNWARPQHLWVAERAAELSLIAAVTEESAAAARAAELLAAYDELYFALPNRDNVLGPSHLFFSTYLESLWITSYLAGAVLLREAGVLSEERQEGVSRIADEAATIIGEFNEGFSNRQTWHSAALIAIAVWFGDEDLARNTVESRTGLVGHLADGFGNDGLWWEGENYHLFALRGLMQGMHWARAAGYDLIEDAAVRSHFQAALMAPTRSALPDFTFPARRDSRFGVSLAQPAYLELWEIGRAWLGGEVEQLDAWLSALYALPAPPAEHYDAWLHDAGRPKPERRTRGDLSWWALTAMGGALPATAPAWNSESVLLGDQGLAVLRLGDCYASLECGRVVGGHGHPDRLNLTVHAGGTHWLADFGTGSYVVPALAWYRSAMAHNAPRLDGLNGGGGEDAWCEAFDTGEELAWCRGRAGEVRRTVVAAPQHLIDILEVESGDPRRVDLPWHVMGDWKITSPGVWEPATLDHPFVSATTRFVPQGGGPVSVEVRSRGGESEAALRAWILADDAEVIRAVAPGLPTKDEPQPFLLLRATTGKARWVTVLDWSPAASDAAVMGVRAEGGQVEIRTSRGPVRYHLTDSGLSVEKNAVRAALAGVRPAPGKNRRLFEERPAPSSAAMAVRIIDTPALDGGLDGFDTSEPLLLDDEQQYRRSEEPYDPERFSATAFVNWDGSALYLAASVRKPELVFRPAGAPSLELDNESEDINSDGLQVYLGFDESAVGVLVVPQEGGGLQVRSIEGIGGAGGGGGGGQLAARGGWAPTEDGYCVTLRLDDPRIGVLHHGIRLGFDLLINEMQPDRTRRAGQLVWSGGGGGGNGWIYLRGDRQDPSEFGTLELG